jgi:hypothetical protein
MKTPNSNFSALACFFCFSITAHAFPWTNTEGKTIEAEFVKIEDKKVVLRNKAQIYKVPLEKLNKDSQGFALYIQQTSLKWAAAKAALPIISEEMLLQILAFQPELAEGKYYLVEGNVSAIGTAGTTLSRGYSTKATATLSGGSKIELDYSTAANGNSTKISIEKDKVVRLRGRDGKFINSDYKYSNFTPEKVLLQVGAPIIVRAAVNKGKIVGAGEPTTAEITEARLLLANHNGGLNAEQVAQLEQLKIRAEFLQAKLDGNAGTATVSSIDGNANVVYHYSDAEKEAMRKELELLLAQINAASKK